LQDASERAGNIIIRGATLADSPAIGAISVAAQRAAYAGVMTPAYLAGLGDSRESARWAEIVRREPRVLVAEIAGVAAGFAHWSEADHASPATAELRDLFVDPRVWRRGVGSRLSHAVMSRMRAAGFHAATLWVVHENARARAFYESFGWRADGAEERHDRFRSGALVHVVRYRRPLSAP
jgi:GNAT superfamily N-acetyltransferase